MSRKRAPQPKRELPPQVNPLASSARILNRLFDDLGDFDPIDTYAEVSARVRYEDGEW